MSELRAELDRSGINGGLVRCRYSSTVGVQYGNTMLARDLTAEEHDIALWGVWAILPSCTGELPPAQVLPEQMKAQRIAAVYLDPVSHRYLPDRVSVGDYLDMAQQCRIPVLLNTALGMTMEQIAGILENFPKLTAILGAEYPWPNGRYLYPLAYHYENVFLDLAYCMDSFGIEDMTKRFGAERILFGSAYPNHYTGSAMAMVRAAQISEEERKLIFGENLIKLIRGWQR